MERTDLRYNTVLLDFHGTFTNSNMGRTAHALNGAYKQVLERSVTKGEFMAIMMRNEHDQGDNSTSISKYLDTTINGHLPVDTKQQLIDTFIKLNKEIYIPKHLHLLRQLHEIGANCVIVTNGIEEEVKKVLEKWGLMSLISGLYGRGQDSAMALNSIPRKPSPKVIDFVVSDLRIHGHSVRLDRTLMVGDYHHDIGAGSNAGIHTAFIIQGPNQRPEDYDYRPTYALVDRLSLKPNRNWFDRENVFPISDLPKIVAGKI